jgi:spore maturation protein CgeB
VVTYTSVDDCVEKARWLLDHPTEREEIARKGQERCLKEHTFRQRAEELDLIIRNELLKR